MSPEGMAHEKFHPNVLKACVWAGPLFAFLWLVGAGPLAFFIIPPVSAGSQRDGGELHGRPDRRPRRVRV